MELSLGNLVKLKSGGPVMTVSEVDGNEVTCVWFPEGDFAVAGDGVLRHDA
jgi:uncharacterized protein YodC (DUF2158 family)